MSIVERTGLIPSRFITLIAHFVMLIVALNCRDPNVKACLPYNYENEEYIEKDRELLLGLVTSLALLGIEMISFIFGFSMFMPLVASISVAVHSVAVILLSYWLIDTWDCVFFWWIFIFCSFLPGCIEISVLISGLAIKRIIC